MKKLLILMCYLVVFAGTSQSQLIRFKVDTVKATEGIKIKYIDRTSFFDNLNSENETTNPSYGDSTISLDKLTTAAYNFISSGGNVTNNPDDVTLESKPGSTIGIRSEYPDDSLRIDVEGLEVPILSHLENAGMVIALDFGTTTNATTTTNMIQAAIDSLSSVSPFGGTVLIPPGTYELTDTDADGYAVVIDKHYVQLKGTGSSGYFATDPSALYPVNFWSTDSITLFKVQRGTTQDIYGTVFENIGFNGKNAAGGKVIDGIHFKGAWSPTVRNCGFFRMNRYGVYVDSSGANASITGVIENSSFRFCDAAVSYNWKMNGFEFTGGNFRVVDCDTGLVLGNFNLVQGIDIERADVGIVIRDANRSQLNMGKQNRIQGNNFEDVDTCIVLTGNERVEENIIIGNKFNGHLGESDDIGIYFGEDINLPQIIMGNVYAAIETDIHISDETALEFFTVLEQDTISLARGEFEWGEVDNVLTTPRLRPDFFEVPAGIPGASPPDGDMSRINDTLYVWVEDSSAFFKVGLEKTNVSAWTNTYALSFDGNDIATETDTDTLDSGTSDWEWSWWMYLYDDTPDSTQYVFSYRDNLDRYDMRMLTSGVASAIIQTGTNYTAQGSGKFTDSTWYFVRLRFDQSDLFSIYVNNNLYASVDVSGETVDFSSPTNDLTIGDRYDLAGPFEGIIDELTFHRRLLTDTEVEYMLNNKSGRVNFMQPDMWFRFENDSVSYSGVDTLSLSTPTFVTEVP